MNQITRDLLTEILRRIEDLEARSEECYKNFLQKETLSQLIHDQESKFLSAKWGTKEEIADLKEFLVEYVDIHMTFVLYITAKSFQSAADLAAPRIYGKPNCFAEEYEIGIQGIYLKKEICKSFVVVIIDEEGKEFHTDMIFSVLEQSL